jgi:DNA-binding beta-propeller fold protein YncE
MQRPTGITMDGAGNLYVTDPDNGTAPAVYVFSAASLACTVPPCSLNLIPTRAITSAGATPNNTKLVNPTDVAVDGAGNIYVVDAGNAPNSSMLLIFSPAANGNVAPRVAVRLSGTATGMALSP